MDSQRTSRCSSRKRASNMTDLNEELAKWFEKLQAIPSQYHLLCPKLSDEDNENYRIPYDPSSEISADEKKKRVQDGERRVEITYWNSLIFGFDKKDAGKWLDDFTERLDGCLKYCSDCVLNWHMKRRAHLQKFAEYGRRCALHVQDGRGGRLTCADVGMKMLSRKYTSCSTAST